MKARAALPLALLLGPLLTGCPRRDDTPPPSPPGYPPPGQWSQPAPPPPPPPQGPWQPTPGSPFPVPWPTLPPGLPTLPGWGGQQPLPTPFSDPAQRCVDVINQYRATVRLPPLSRWIMNESCVGTEARDSATMGQPHGAFGHCGELAQNVCPDWAGPADRMIAPCIQSQWAEGPGGDYATHGHFINMTSSRYTKVACGYFTTPAGQVWAIQNFQ